MSGYQHWSDQEDNGAIGYGDDSLGDPISHSDGDAEKYFMEAWEKERKREKLNQRLWKMTNN